jgi:hypothetical protein
MAFLRLRRTDGRNGNPKKLPEDRFNQAHPASPKENSDRPAAEPPDANKGTVYSSGEGDRPVSNRLRRTYPSVRAAGRTLHPTHPKVSRREARDLHDPTSLPCLVYFAQTTLTSFRLQGVDPSEDQASLSAPLPPVPFVPASGRGSELRRFDPSGSRSLTPKRCAPSPHDVFPLRFSLSPRWGTASRPLLSRAFDFQAKDYLSATR